MLAAGRCRPGRPADRRRPAGVHLVRRRRGRPPGQPRRRRRSARRPRRARRAACPSPATAGTAAATCTSSPAAGTCTATRSAVEGSELLARAIQHETDHLDGVLFVDRLDAEARAAALAELEAAEWAGIGRVPAGARPGREGEPPLRLLFAGTPAPAVPSLEALLASDHEVVAVLTRPDARSGRGRKASRSPVAERADAAGIPVLQPRSPREPEFLEQLADARRRLRPGRRLRRARAAGGARPARGTAGSTCTSRCCPPGAAPPRCSTRSWPATRSPAPSTFRLEAGPGHRPGLRHGHRADRAPGHRRRPARPARRQRRRPAGRHPRRHRGRHAGRRAAAGRGHQPRAADRARRRPRRLVAARLRGRPAGPRGHAGARAPGRRGAATGCGSARSSRCPTVDLAGPRRGRGRARRASSSAPAAAPSASARCSRPASGCSPPPTGRAARGPQPGERVGE